MNTLDKYYRLLASEKPAGRGLDSEFFSLSDDVGFKVFYNVNAANTAFEKQSILHDMGFAAPVLTDLIELKDRVFGFETGKALVAEHYLRLLLGVNLRDIRDWSQSFEIDGQQYMYEDIVFWERSNVFPEFNELKERMNSKGIYDGDVHIGNYGWYRKEPVIIDTGWQVEMP